MVVLDLALLRVIADAAEAAYPEEACGLLVGRVRPGGARRVSRVEPAENVAADRRTTFEVDAGLRIGLERELRGTPDRVVGHFHSHPDGPARPSATDLARAFETGLVWLIVSVVGGQASQTQAYMPRSDGSGFREITLSTLSAPRNRAEAKGEQR